jgi:hypothetical protein
MSFHFSFTTLKTKERGDEEKKNERGVDEEEGGG